MYHHIIFINHYYILASFHCFNITHHTVLAETPHNQHPPHTLDDERLDIDTTRTQQQQQQQQQQLEEKNCNVVRHIKHLQVTNGWGWFGYIGAST